MTLYKVALVLLVVATLSIYCHADEATTKFGDLNGIKAGNEDVGTMFANLRVSRQIQLLILRILQALLNDGANDPRKNGGGEDGD